MTDCNSSATNATTKSVVTIQEPSSSSASQSSPPKNISMYPLLTEAPSNDQQPFDDSKPAIPNIQEHFHRQSLSFGTAAKPPPISPSKTTPNSIRFSLDNSELHRISRILEKPIFEEDSPQPKQPQAPSSDATITITSTAPQFSDDQSSTTNIYPSIQATHHDELTSTTSVTNTTTTSSITGGRTYRFDDEQLIEAWRKSYRRRNSRAGSTAIYDPKLKTQDDLALIGIQNGDEQFLSQWKQLPSKYYSKDEDGDTIGAPRRLRVNQSKIIISSDNLNIHVTESVGDFQNMSNKTSQTPKATTYTFKDLGFSSSSEESDVEPRGNDKKVVRRKKKEIHTSQNDIEMSSNLLERKSPKHGVSPTIFETKFNESISNSPTALHPLPETATTNLPGPFLEVPKPRRIVNHIRQESLYTEHDADNEEDYVVKKADVDMIEKTKEIPKIRQNESYNVNDYLNMKPVKDMVDGINKTVNKNIIRNLRKADDDEDFSEDEEESAVTAPPTITETNGTKTEEKQKKKFEVLFVNNREENKNSRKSWPSNYIRTTKYTLLSFIPKNLFEQFKKATNIYFLISVIAVLIPGVSPVFPATAIIPLVAIVLLQMIKDGIEDFQRYLQDRSANNCMCRVIRDGIVVEIKFKEVEIGDIVMVSKEETFPADLLCIHSTREDDLCYVETSNLDGETNLKTRRSLKSGKFLRDIPEHTIHKELSSLKGQLKIEAPSNNLDSFEGKVKIFVKGKDKKECLKEGVSMDNLLLRGCTLKNTKMIYGVALYIGKHTKMQKNLKENKVKRNTLDIALNKILIVLLLLQQVICGVFAGLAAVFQSTYGAKSFYLRSINSSSVSFSSVMSDWLTFFVLLNLMIPMSLVVGLEIIKTLQSKVMESDEEMKFGKFKAEVKSSNMNQGLSQLDVIFSDKTGTLTQNEMKYSDSWVGGLYYSELNNPGMMKHYLQNDPKHGSEEPSVSDTAAYHGFLLREFLLCLSLNNTVIPERDPQNPDNIIYDGPSSDEIALLDAAKNNGYKLLQRTNAGVLLEELGEKKFYEIYATLEFSSDRKRMSVIVKHPDGKYVCYCKGADSVMIKRSRARKHFVADLKLALETFSIKGLRTLVCARKELTDEEFKTWFEGYTKASLSTKNREKLLTHSAADIEIDLQLLGCTAIEDKLQEDVLESIEFLGKAGFQIWVLTGDKTETAINVAYSTGVLHKDETIEIRIRDAHNHKHLKKKMKVALEFLERQKNKNFEYALIIDSKSLDLALEKYEKQFLRIVTFMKSAVCCRLKPLQKALIVKLVENKLKKKALAIGDGTNDVAMIQAASIGVGIKGKEGAQASRSADYSLPRFKNLVRLVAIHGRYCNVRNSDFLHYSFYKNILVVMPQILYCIYTGFSGTIFFESWLLTMFNTIYCFFQPLVAGIFEEDLPEEVILKHPEIYKTLKGSALFNFRTLTAWVLNGIYHSLVIFYGVMLCFDGDIMENGPGDLYHYGTVIMTATLSVITFRIALNIKTWRLITHIIIWGSFLSYFVFCVIYTPIPIFLGKGTFYFIYFHTFISVKATLVTLLVVIVSLIPDVVFKFVRFNYFPRDYQQLLVEYKHEAKTLTKRKKQGEEIVTTIGVDVIDNIDAEIKDNSTVEKV